MSMQPMRSAAPTTEFPERFQIVADLCPQVILRVLGLFAQQSIIPSAVSMRRRRRTLVIELAFDGVGGQAAAILLNKIAAIVTVRSARRTGPSRRRRINNRA